MSGKNYEQDQTIEKRNPSIATVDADALTVTFADRGTYQQAVRTLNDKGIELYETNEGK
jgi:hypothetical protein